MLKYTSHFSYKSSKSDKHGGRIFYNVTLIKPLGQYQIDDEFDEGGINAEQKVYLYKDLRDADPAYFEHTPGFESEFTPVFCFKCNQYLVRGSCLNCT